MLDEINNFRTQIQTDSIKTTTAVRILEILEDVLSENKAMKEKLNVRLSLLTGPTILYPGHHYSGEEFE